MGRVEEASKIRDDTAKIEAIVLHFRCRFKVVRIISGNVASRCTPVEFADDGVAAADAGEISDLDYVRVDCFFPDDRSEK